MLTYSDVCIYSGATRLRVTEKFSTYAGVCRRSMPALKELSSCNCAEGHCYHPWAKHTPHFSPSDNNMIFAKSGIRKSDTSEGKMKYPSRQPPLIPEFYAACHFPETMPDVVNTDNPIQGMLSHAAMMSSRKKTQRLSAYEADPITVDD